jgi:uncharacterized membrane protein YfcA
VSPAEAAAIVTLAFAASTVQAATGLGFGLLIIPPLVLVIGVKDAVVVSNVLSTALSTMLLGSVHGGVNWRLASVLFVAACAGMPFGLLVLIASNPDYLQAAIAGGVIVFTIALARGVRLPPRGIATDVATGLFSGVLRTSTSMSGPPVALLMQGRGMEREGFRATITAFFVATGLVSIAVFLASGRIDAEAAAQMGIALPAVVAGLGVGALLYRQVGEGVFRQAVLAVLLVSAGIALVAVFVG